MLVRSALATGAKSLSRHLAYLPSNVMSASAPQLAELPTETLEHVLLHLPGQDIIKMEMVRRLSPTPREWLLIFVSYDPGQSTIPGPHS